MTTEGWLILASMFFGFVFGYGWANSAKYAAVWEEYYRTKRRGGKEKVKQPSKTQDTLDTLTKGTIACSACRHANFLVADLDRLTSGYMCQASPEIEHCWDAIKGHYDIEHYQFCRNVNHDGNCKLFETKSESVTIPCQTCGLEIRVPIDSPVYQEKMKNGSLFYCGVCAPAEEETE